MKRDRIVIIAGLSALALAWALVVPGEAGKGKKNKGSKQTGTVTVTGEGSSFSAPDMAEINLGLTTQAKTAAEALASNNEVMQALLELLKAQGIAEKDVQTSNFSINPNYDHDPRGQRPPTISGYSVSNQVHVKVRKLSEFGKLLDVVVQNGANQIHGINFSVAEPLALLDQARTKAIADARRKAELYAEAAGATLGRVMVISEQSSGGPIPMPMARMAMMAESSVPLATGEQELSANISVTFELIAKASK